MAYIKKLPSGRWQAQIRLKGLKPITRSFDTKGKASTFARQVEGDTEIARKLGAPTVDIITFDKLVELYMSDYRGKDPNVGQRLQFWCQQFGDRPVPEITEFDVDEGLQVLSKRKGRRGPMTGSSINRYKSHLSAVLIWFIRHPDYKRIGYSNPVRAESVARFSENPAKDRFLDEQEQVALLDACKRSTWDRMHLFVLLALTTGARKGELLGLKWEHIDLSARTAYLGETKTGKPRLLPLTRNAVTELMKYRGRPGHLVFHSTTSKGTAFDTKKAWASALRESGIGHLRVHDLRHSAASNMVRAGRSLFEVATLLGHSNTTMTARYSHLAITDTQDMVDAVAGHLG